MFGDNDFIIEKVDEIGKLQARVAELEGECAVHVAAIREMGEWVLEYENDLDLCEATIDALVDERWARRAELKGGGE